ncbi:MAG TPA: hemerythrin domain-containing protein [Polyangiaceae bacterium]|jgi:hypothetical protein
MERAHSTATGSVLGPAGEAAGLGGIFNRLIQEHGELTTLIRRARMSADAGLRRDVYRTIRAELAVHERAESSVLYAELQRYPETRRIATQHAGFARELEEGLRELDALDAAGDEWIAAFERFSELVHAHVEEEENAFFPLARQTLGDSASWELERQYKRVKQGFANSIV